MKTYSATIAVDPAWPNKREQLTAGLDMALILGGIRIQAGVYEVSVRRLSKAEVAAQQTEGEK